MESASEKVLSMQAADMKMSAKMNLPEGQAPEMVPMFLDRGILISEPAEGQVLYRGRTLRLTYTVENSMAAGGSNITFTLNSALHPAQNPIATLTHRHSLQETDEDEPHSIDWFLPNDVPVGSYYTIQARLDEDTHGESYRFTIQHLSDHGIVISEPSEGQELRRGTAIRLNYLVSNSMAAGGSNITFSLHPDGDRDAEPVASMTHRHALQDTDRDIAHSISWPLPGDIPVGENYIIMARLDEDRWGESAHFAIRHLIDPVEAGLSGDEAGIRVQYPEGGETYRPGNTLPCRWNYTDPSTPVSGNMDFDLVPYCDYNYDSFNPSIVSGNPNNPNSDSVLRIPEGIEEGLYCLVVKDNEEASLKGFSRSFEIRRPSGSIGEGHGSDADMPSEPELRVVRPGVGGEHWRTGTTQPIKWQFYPGAAGTLPGSWTITLYRWDPDTGYSVARTFTPNPFDVHRVNQGGLDWWEYTHNWSIPETLHIENRETVDYKLRVSGMDYHSESNLNFTIGHYSEETGERGWNLKIQDLRIDNIDLVAMVTNEGGARGGLDYSVEIGSAARQVSLSAPPETSREGRSPVVLGQIQNLADDLSQYECGIPVKVMVDSTDHVDEYNEDDNEFEKTVYLSMVPFSIKLIRSSGAEINSSGAEVQCDADASDNHQIVIIQLQNCSSISRNGRIIVNQTGGPWTYEANLWDRSDIFVHPGETKRFIVEKRHLRRTEDGQIVDSAIKVYFEGDFASRAAHNPWNLWLDVLP
jgi:hypothetical protein